MKCEAEGFLSNEPCGKKARFRIIDIECDFDKDTSIFFVCKECVSLLVNQKELEPHYIILEDLNNRKKQEQEK